MSKTALVDSQTDTHGREHTQTNMVLVATVPLSLPASVALCVCLYVRAFACIFVVDG